MDARSLTGQSMKAEYSLIAFGKPAPVDQPQFELGNDIHFHIYDPFVVGFLPSGVSHGELIIDER